MDERLSKLADCCVEAHVTSSTTRDAKKVFKAMLTQAHLLGVQDEENKNKVKKEIKSETVIKKNLSKETQQIILSGNKAGKKTEQEKSQQKESQQKESIDPNQALDQF